MTDLKEASMRTHKAWIAAGRLRAGPIFATKPAAKLAYQRTIRTKKREEQNFYINDLHEALMKKNPVAFWKMWRSKMCSLRSDPVVEGHSDPAVIVADFAAFYGYMAKGNTSATDVRLSAEYAQQRDGYVGDFCDPLTAFDVELVSRV